MAFNYEKNKNSEGNDSFWTSYSDLFLGLSTIFLLLYVMASLRTGTDAIKSQSDNQKLSTRVEELENQLKMYESVKKNYMDTAAKDEQQEYQDLMDKLTLLQEEAKSEKDRLANEATENGKKAQALNKYQQMVRNILNANKVAKSRIVTRNEIITDQDTQIDEQQKDIGSLKGDIAQKTQLIEEGNRQIAANKAALDKKMKELQLAYKKDKMTKAAYNKQVQSIKAQNEARLANLQSTNQQYNQQLAQANQELNQLNSALAGTQAELSQTKEEAAARAAKEAQFRAEAGKKAAELQGKVAGLKGQLKSTEGDLAKAKEEIDTRKAVAKEIKAGFAKAGIKADVDMGTGDVVLDFGDAYFDSNSANLKPEMKNVIERAMPIYSKSLFGNPKVASKISNVEIIGFASPTYQGRFIDPKSTKPEDKAALKYNMDLSYKRANAIFQHIVDGKTSGFTNQQELMSLMKVSGRSFLDVLKVKDRNIASAAEFCRVNDCRKAQRVIVRFSVDGK